MPEQTATNNETQDLEDFDSLNKTAQKKKTFVDDLTVDFGGGFKLGGATQAIELDKRFRMNTPQKLTTLSQDSNILFAVSQTDANNPNKQNLLASFSKTENSIVLEMTEAFYRNLVAQNGNLFPQVEAKNGIYTFEVEKLQLSKDGNIQDVQLKGAGKDFSFLFSALGFQAKNPDGKKVIFKCGEQPFNLTVGKLFLQEAQKENSSCTMEENEHLETALYIGLLHDARTKEEDANKPISIDLPQAGLISIPMPIQENGETRQEYFNIVKKDGESYIYVQTEGAGKNVPDFRKIHSVSMVNDTKDGKDDWYLCFDVNSDANRSITFNVQLSRESLDSLDPSLETLYQTLYGEFNAPEIQASEKKPYTYDIGKLRLPVFAPNQTQQARATSFGNDVVGAMKRRYVGTEEEEKEEEQKMDVNNEEEQKMENENGTGPVIEQMIYTSRAEDHGAFKLWSRSKGYIIKTSKTEEDVPHAAYMGHGAFDWGKGLSNALSRYLEAKRQAANLTGNDPKTEERRNDIMNACLDTYFNPVTYADGTIARGEIKILEGDENFYLTSEEEYSEDFDYREKPEEARYIIVATKLMDGRVLALRRSLIGTCYGDARNGNRFDHLLVFPAGTEIEDLNVEKLPFQKGLAPEYFPSDQHENPTAFTPAPDFLPALPLLKEYLKPHEQQQEPVAEEPITPQPEQQPVAEETAEQQHEPVNQQPEQQPVKQQAEQHEPVDEKPASQHENPVNTSDTNTNGFVTPYTYKESAPYSSADAGKETSATSGDNVSFNTYTSDTPDVTVTNETSTTQTDGTSYTSDNTDDDSDSTKTQNVTPYIPDPIPPLTDDSADNKGQEDDEVTFNPTVAETSEETKPAETETPEKPFTPPLKIKEPDPKKRNALLITGGLLLALSCLVAFILPFALLMLTVGTIYATGLHNSFKNFINWLSTPESERKKIKYNEKTAELEKTKSKLESQKAMQNNLETQIQKLENLPTPTKKQTKLLNKLRKRKKSCDEEVVKLEAKVPKLEKQVEIAKKKKEIAIQMESLNQRHVRGLRRRQAKQAEKQQAYDAVKEAKEEFDAEKTRKAKRKYKKQTNKHGFLRKTETEKDNADAALVDYEYKLGEEEVNQIRAVQKAEEEIETMENGLKKPKKTKGKVKGGD